MRWLIIYLLAMAVIWLFIRNTSWRRGLMAAVTTVFAVLMIILTLSEDDSDNAEATANQ
jgi:cell division protein FtsW (lipid II flippase)